MFTNNNKISKSCITKFGAIVYRGPAEDFEYYNFLVL